MKNKSSLIAYGLMSLALVMGIFLSVKSVNQTQDTRSSASEEETLTVDEKIDGVCGTSNGKTVEFAPVDEECCTIGAINWYDSEATDGEYNWSCIGTEDGKIDDCVATLKK